MKDNKRIDFSTKALIIRDDKFLVMHNKGVKEDLWELPGGRMEFGENAEETLEREIREETGLGVRPIKILDTWNLMLRENYQITGVIYLCKLEDGDISLSEEHDDFKWLEASKDSAGFMYSVFRKKMLIWDWEKIKDLVDGYKKAQP